MDAHMSKWWGRRITLRSFPVRNLLSQLLRCLTLNQQGREEMYFSRFFRNGFPFIINYFSETRISRSCSIFCNFNANGQKCVHMKARTASYKLFPPLTTLLVVRPRTNSHFFFLQKTYYDLIHLKKNKYRRLSKPTNDDFIQHELTLHFSLNSIRWRIITSREFLHSCR